MKYFKIICLYICLFMVGCQETRPNTIEQTAYNEGIRAFQFGVPANANPYIHYSGRFWPERYWLNGWIDAKEKEENAK